MKVAVSCHNPQGLVDLPMESCCVSVLKSASYRNGAVAGSVAG